MEVRKMGYNIGQIGKAYVALQKNVTPDQFNDVDTYNKIMDGLGEINYKPGHSLSAQQARGIARHLVDVIKQLPKEVNIPRACKNLVKKMK